MLRARRRGVFGGLCVPLRGHGEVVGQSMGSRGRSYSAGQLEESPRASGRGLEERILIYCRILFPPDVWHLIFLDIRHPSLSSLLTVVGKSSVPRYMVLL